MTLPELLILHAKLLARLVIMLLVAVPVIIFLSWALKHLLVALVAFSGPVVFELVLPLAACVFAVLVFCLPNPMHGLLALLGVFFSTVLFYVAAGIAFIGLVFLIVYVGAVAVLFLFVIMLLNVKSMTSTERLITFVTQVGAMISTAIMFDIIKLRIMERGAQLVAV
jgi:NADH:ubiquinone oxidoreductase subunit 6 (subunit J)